ncbi:MAG: hypothetical protein ABSG97_03915 [Sedimentisphaerales bacterium]|jgi:hypothetical protein
MSETQTEIQGAKCLSDKELAEIGELIGEILLALQSPFTPEERQEFWQCFESLLGRYVEGKKKG